MYEAYIDDPAYLEPVDDSESVVEPVQNNVIENVANVNTNTPSMYQVDYYNATEDLGDEDQQDLTVPQVSERNDIISEALGKVDPLGVTYKDNINGGSIWDILQQIWPYIMSIMFSFFIFFILLAKRRKDDEEEEAVDSKK